ncbi:MAG TPA: hypothetical protein DCG69_12755 [Bacteroidales bacterium]|nr:hypothetical protein [Bacteroidales bacterium]
MKKIFYLFLIFGLVAVSCNKPEEAPLEQDVVFKATTSSTGFKAGTCDNADASYALVEIDNEIKQVGIIYLDGAIYTNTLKLAPGSHTISMFVLKNDNNTPNETSDDIEVLATPLTGANYASFVAHSLPFDFTVDAFMKTEVEIDVLCFEAADITDFGFAWFAVNKITVRELCFFGDFCTKYYEDYAGSLYAQQEYGLRHDMPAIFKIDVKRNGNPLVSYNNEAWLGEGAPLCVQYPDYDGVVDTYEFNLSILVKVGTLFQYKPFYTWTITDGGSLPNIGTDNVMDFVLGSCVPDADLILPPYMNLPIGATVRTGSYSPGSLGTYFDVTLSNIGAGFDIQNGTYGVYCGDLQTSIYLSQTYNLNVFSSLYPAYVPAAFNLQKAVLDNINWLGNNLYRYPSYTYKDLQNAVWMLLGQLNETTDGGLGVPTALSIKMKNDALAYGDGFLPPVGGYAAVLFISPDATSTSRVLQLLFTLVDP